MDLRRKQNKSIHDFIICHDTAVADVKVKAGEISDEILAIQLLDSINLNSIERQNIVANVKFKNNQDFYEDVNKSI